MAVAVGCNENLHYDDLSEMVFGGVKFMIGSMSVFPHGG
jgi:hypothetical protein